MQREMDYEGKVYCPSTDDGIIYVRRKGLAFWCGNSHEMVRHRGNMSQRSGRFVDETDRAFCLHPYLTYYLKDEGITDRETLSGDLAQYVMRGQGIYTDLVDRLQKWIQEKQNLDALTARKQARSAARYFLGNGLSTEMVFTASIRHWRHIFNMRCSPHADAAIRQLMEKTREIVKNSRYGHML